MHATSKPSRSLILPYGIAAVVTAVTMIGFSVVFDALSHLSSRIFQQHSLLTVLFTGSCFFAAWACVAFGAPMAGGSGIPQVILASQLDLKTHSPTVERLLSLKCAVIKVISTLMCALGGAAIGREGPTIQISSAIFYQIGKRAKIKWEKINLDSFIVAGGAAGVASAFNTPLGGIVFAIEELMTAHFHDIKSTLIYAVVICGLISQWLLGSYLYFGAPDLAPFVWTCIPAVMLVALAAGLAGGVLSKLLQLGLRAKTKFMTRKSHAAGLAFVAGCFVATLGLVYGFGAIGSGKQLIEELLFQHRAADVSIVVARIAASLVSYLSGCAGGVFAPSLAAGAAVGSSIASMIGHGVDSNLLILVGMIGFLTAVTNAPFTSFVLVLEMTDRHSAVLPMMLAAALTYGVSRFVNQVSLYDAIKEGFHKQLA